MKLQAVTAREASIFACITDAFCVPVGDFPAVADTTTVEFFDQYVLNSPRSNRAFLRALFLAAELAPLVYGYRSRLRRLDPEARARFLDDVSRSSLTVVKAAFKVAKSIANTAYYSDDQVHKLCGYDPEANVARGRALREKEGRP